MIVARRKIHAQDTISIDMKVPEIPSVVCVRVCLYLVTSKVHVSNTFSINRPRRFHSSVVQESKQQSSSSSIVRKEQNKTNIQHKINFLLASPKVDPSHGPSVQLWRGKKDRNHGAHTQKPRTVETRHTSATDKHKHKRRRNKNQDETKPLSFYPGFGNNIECMLCILSGSSSSSSSWRHC